MIKIKFGTGDFAGALFRFNAYNKDNSISCSFKLPTGQDNVRKFEHLISCSKAEFDGSLLDQMILGGSCCEIGFKDSNLGFDKNVSDFNISSNFQLTRDKDSFTVDISNINFDRLDMVLRYYDVLANLMKNGDNKDIVSIHDFLFEVENLNNGLEHSKDIYSLKGLPNEASKLIKDKFLDISNARGVDVSSLYNFISRNNMESTLNIDLLQFTRGYNSLSDTYGDDFQIKLPIGNISLDEIKDSLSRTSSADSTTEVIQVSPTTNKCNQDNLDISVKRKDNKLNKADLSKLAITYKNNVFINELLKRFGSNNNSLFNDDFLLNFKTNNSDISLLDSLVSAEGTNNDISINECNKNADTWRNGVTVDSQIQANDIINKSMLYLDMGKFLSSEVIEGIIDKKDLRLSGFGNCVETDKEALMCNLSSRDEILVNKLKNVSSKDYGLSSCATEKSLSKDQYKVSSYDQVFLAKGDKYLSLLNKEIQLSSTPEFIDYMSFVTLTSGDRGVDISNTGVRISSYAKFILKNNTNLTTSVKGKDIHCNYDSKFLDSSETEVTEPDDINFVNKANFTLNINSSLKGINNGVNKLLINNNMDLSKSHSAKANIEKNEWVYKHIDGAFDSSACEFASNSNKTARKLEDSWMSEPNKFLDIQDVIFTDNAESKPAVIDEHTDMLDSNGLKVHLDNQRSTSGSSCDAYLIDEVKTLGNSGEECITNNSSQVSPSRTNLNHKKNYEWLAREGDALIKNEMETSCFKDSHNPDIDEQMSISVGGNDSTIIPNLIGLDKSGDKVEKYGHLSVNKQGNAIRKDYFLKTLNFEQLNVGILNTKNLEGGGKELSSPQLNDIGITTNVNAGYAENTSVAGESSDTDLFDIAAPLVSKSGEDCAVYEVNDFNAHKYNEIEIDSQKFGHVNDFVPPINILKGATDELQLPNSDFNYKKYEDVVFSENLSVSRKCLKGFNDNGNPIINLPLENPVTYFSNIAVNFISIDVSIMRKVLELLYNNWRRSIHRFAGIDPAKAMNKILEDTHAEIKEWYTSRTDVDRVLHAERSLKLFAWYCEMAILSYADYSVKYTRANAVFDFWSELPSFSINKKEVVKGINSDEIVKFDNFYYDNSKPYIVGSKPGELATLEIRNVPQSCDTTLTFKAFIMGSGRLKVSTSNNAYDFNCKKNDVSITLPSDDNGFTITFIPSDDKSFVDISQFKILDRYNTDYELEYTGKVANVNFTIQYILDVMTITGDSIEEAAPVLKSSAPLAYALERFKEYMEIHHNSKYKGKRLTVRNT